MCDPYHTRRRRRKTGPAALYYKKANECNRKATRPNADSWSDWTTATKKECESYSLDKAKKPIALHTQGYQLGVSSDGRRAILPDGWNDEQNKQRKSSSLPLTSLCCPWASFCLDRKWSNLYQPGLF